MAPITNQIHKERIKPARVSKSFANPDSKPASSCETMVPIVPYPNGRLPSPKQTNKIKKMACVECRQQKSRCNALEVAPSPCTRCATRGLVCTLKPGYKRTYKRARNAQLENAYNDLRHTLNDILEPIQKDGDLSLLNGQLLEKLNQVVHAANAIQDAEIEEKSALKPENKPFVLTEECLCCSEKTLMDTKLSPEQIKQLYQEYALNYHPILPVIDIKRGPERIYRLCPVLFWVVMLTSLRRHSDPDSSSLLIQLSPAVKKLLEDLTVGPITRYSPSEFDEPVFNASSVYSVQAFIITTMWPRITSSLSADSSWNTIGIALFQAVRIGLHSPGHANDFSNAAKTDDSRQLLLMTEQIRTWTCCNIVSQTISTALGYPAFTSLDNNLMRFIESNNGLNISSEVKNMMEITDYESQIVNTLSASLSANERSPLIKVLEQRLDKMMLVQDFNSMDNYRKLMYLNARVHLYTYYFFDVKNDINEMTISSKKGLVQLFEACVTMIEHCQMSQTSDKRFIKYLPGVYVISIWEAAFMIPKLCFSPLRTMLDFEKGKNMYQVAIYLTLRNSVMKFDIAHRFSGIMKSLWQLFDTLYVKKSLRFEVTITSRMAASVFFDCLMILRQQSGTMKLMIKKEEDDDVASDVEGLDDNKLQSKSGNNQEMNSANSPGYDSDDYAASENSDTLDEKIKDIGSTPSEGANGQRTSSNEIQSNGSKRSHHTLEEIALRPESSARKIIKTIPLDPQPVKELSPSSTISPKFSPFTGSPQTASIKEILKPKHHENPSDSYQSDKHNENNSPGNINDDKPVPSLPDWLTTEDGDTHLESDLNALLKDVSSVMNDFGFYTEESLFK